MHIHLLVHYVGKYVNCWYNGPTCCWLWSGVSTAQWSYIRSINIRLALLDYSHIAINLNSNMTHNVLVILNIKQTWSWLMDEKQIFYTRSLNILIFPPHPPHFLVIQGISIKMFPCLSVLCDSKSGQSSKHRSCYLICGYVFFFKDFLAIPRSNWTSRCFEKLGTSSFQHYPKFSGHNQLINIETNFWTPCSWSMHYTSLHTTDGERVTKYWEKQSAGIQTQNMKVISFL